MHDEIPRNLPERTGRHVCVKCLAEVTAAEYLQNDYLCENCVAEDEYPLASTPDDAPEAAVQPIPAVGEKR
ncbi:MAG TPA: hypothetical protein VEZ11_13540 [Thermoanaerobaculia bacterium]|nr:hypothetical protein [Thermoanaerobaculia bacterium]